MNWIDMILHTADSAIRSIMGMRDRVVVRRTLPGPERKELRKSVSPLVHSRPAQMEDRWGVLDNSKEVDAIFSSLKKKLF